MKYFFYGLGILIAISLVGMVLKVVLFPAKVAGNLIDTGYKATDKVLNADNAIYNYEWFKKQYEDIEATKRKMNNAAVAHLEFRESLPKSRLEWTFEDKQEDSRLNSIYLGLSNHLEGLIGDYNARAKMSTRNIFQNSVLPDYIDALTFIGR